METIKDLGKYTFPCLLANSVKKFADRPAVAQVGQKEFTYSEVNEKSQEFSKQLLSLGLSAGSKIAILGVGKPNWGIAYFGIVNQGMIAVPLLTDFSKTEISAIMNHCGVDAIIVEKRLFEKNKEIESDLPSIVIDLDTFQLIKGEVKNQINELPEIEVQEDDTASIIYTSGTTGRSKGVELSHKNLVFSAMSGQAVRRVNKFDRCLSFLPLSHVYEFSVGFSMQMMNGSCVYYLGRPPVVSALLPAFAIVKPTIVLSVPLIIEKIYKSKVLPTLTKNGFMKFLYKIRPVQKLLHRVAGKSLIKTFGGKLNFFGIGGSKIDPNVERFMRDAKFPYAIGYGLTETAPLLAGCGPKITWPETLGFIIPEVDVQIANPNPETGVGEIVAKGPNVMKGYYKDPELTKASFTTAEDSCGEGYFKTGDLGTYEKIHGMWRLSLKGRSKNMILGPNGENIYPEDLEFVLNQHPLVSESLVVESDDGLVALVQIDEDKLKSLINEFKNDINYTKESVLNEIQFFVNSKINKNSQIRKIQTVPEFEKTASQKIKRYLYDMKTKVSEKAEQLKKKK
ncbi:MAG: AMP-binding protein [Treponema sp.]|nr:AMP-binding protein [Treponema sp.]MDY5122821.1 AMP-binding protein [Treponema sp.]